MSEMNVWQFRGIEVSDDYAAEQLATYAKMRQELLDESHENFSNAVIKVEERLEADEGNVTEQDLLRLKIGVAGVAKDTGNGHGSAAAAKKEQVDNQ